MVYGLGRAELAIVAIGVIGGGFVRLAASMLQSDERYVASTLASESINYLLLAAALGAVAVGATTGDLAAGDGRRSPSSSWRPWSGRRCWPHTAATRARRCRCNMTEMLLLSATNAAMLVLFQVERFAIPMFLGLEQLAAFAVLSVFTIAPFRPIEFSTYRTLVPKMRRPGTGPERRRLFLREVGQISALLAALGLGIAVVTPFALSYLFGDKYHFPFGAVLAGVAGGQLGSRAAWCRRRSPRSRTRRPWRSGTRLPGFPSAPPSSAAGWAPIGAWRASSGAWSWVASPTSC